MYLFLMVFLTYQPSYNIIIHNEKVYGSHSMIGLWIGFTKTSSELIQRALGFVKFPFYAVI